MSMKYLSFRFENHTGFGVVDGEEVAVLGGLPGTRWPSLRDMLGDRDAKVGSALGAARRIALKGLALEPVIPDPGIIFCVGLNYAPHIKEMGRELPTYPSIFSRTARSQIGHGQPIVVPRVSSDLDYEGELAFVIGKGGRYIAEADALSHVAGYACYNDASIRDFQKHTTQFTAGKNFWATGPFGPWMVTPDEFGDVGSRSVTTRLNGKVMQNAPFTDLVFSVPHLIAYISSFTELKAGDVIATGTPGGVGTARKPPVYMKAGDVVEIEISGIGILRNPVVAESDVVVPGTAKA
jgi:2-keto-4-pentenoate hydratase/2-oxohepta-3-ene-1,7-dioic acid hydratase in catechol pathway